MGLRWSIVREDASSATWSVRDAAVDDAAGTRVLRDLARICHDACVAQFDEAAGYALVQRRLWGALEGSTTEIRRGSFRAEVSVQRFSRRGGADGDGGEFRVVASGGHRSVALARPAEARGALWLTAAGAAGTTAFGVFGLQVAGALSSWGQLMLMLPLLMLWRMSMALRIAQDLRHDARRLALAAAEPLTPGARDDLDRWHRVLEAVMSQREAVTEAFHGPGFRTPGAMPGTVAALAAGRLLSSPPRAAATPSLALPPLGRITAM